MGGTRTRATASVRAIHPEDGDRFASDVFAAYFVDGLDIESEDLLPRQWFEDWGATLSR